MDKIYHEKQVDRFCAQHCLNSLLQGPYFTLESLVEIAHNLDERERATRNASVTDCFNNDESGDFSIQVIAVALQNLGLELVPYLRNSDEAAAARADPTSQTAFICHFDMHWLAIRRLGNQWFDLNSLRSQPQLISNTYLSMYLTQLNSEKYSIWFVTGNFPDCEADTYLALHPLSDSFLRRPTGANASTSKIDDTDPDTRRAVELSLRDDLNDASLLSVLAQTQREAEERELQEALRLSMQTANPQPLESSFNSEERELQEALRLSLSEARGSSSSGGQNTSNANYRHC